MPAAPTHEFVVRGRIARHQLGPFLDDFAVSHDEEGQTRLVGVVIDAAHVHGLVAHLASINAELIAITPVAPSARRRPAHHDRSTP